MKPLTFWEQAQLIARLMVDGYTADYAAWCVLNGREPSHPENPVRFAYLSMAGVAW